MHYIYKNITRHVITSKKSLNIKLGIITKDIQSQQ